MLRHALIFVFLLLTNAIGQTEPVKIEATKSNLPVAASNGGGQYFLQGTEVLALHATALQRDYQLFASLPPSYHSTPQRRYPVLFVTDADYAFPVIRSIAARVGDRGAGLQEFIIIGLSYAAGDTPRFSRNRDYTPTANPSEPSSDMPGRAPQYGQAQAYARFLADQVFPLVEQTWRVDMGHKTFVGHSYGALLGLQILLTEPSMFENYILGSPSLWFGQKVMFTRESAYAATHKDMPAHVYMAVGGFETLKPGSRDPRYNRTNDMVADMQAFARLLTSRRYPHLTIDTSVIADEDHLTVFPTLITRALKWAYPINHN